MNPFRARALAAMLDHHSAPDIGSVLPPAWHWLYFLEIARTSATGADGHSELGEFMPPVPTPRRMWAAGSFEIDNPLVLGHPASRRTIIRAVEPKSGKSGELIFVTLEHELHQKERLCLREIQNLVYREKQAKRAASNPVCELATDHEFSKEVRINPVFLFRYSALTYNSHRIHYDLPFATEQEFYPGLVVHGPLLATLLLELVRDNLPSSHVSKYEFRAMRPTFDQETLRLCGRREGNSVALWTCDEKGLIGMRATALLS
jgi:3-methylfumaryl-CoA hydratase